MATTFLLKAFKLKAFKDAKSVTLKFFPVAENERNFYFWLQKPNKQKCTFVSPSVCQSIRKMQS